MIKLFIVYLRWWLIAFIFTAYSVNYSIATWPGSNTSKIQLLGLFVDPPDTNISTEFSVHSRAMFQAALVLSQRYGIMIDGQSIEGQVGQSGGNPIGAMSSTCFVASNSNIIGIVGPAYSREAPIIAQYAESIGIPAISYSATDPELSNKNTYPAFYRTVPSDAIAAIAMVELFKQYNWTSCIIIYQNDAFGSGGVEAISHVFNENKLVVSQTIVFDISEMQIRGDLTDLLSSSATRIVLLWTEDYNVPIILKIALDRNLLGPHFTWILRSNVSLALFDNTSHAYLTGMLFIDSIDGDAINAPINRSLLDTALQIWQEYEPMTYPGEDRVNYYAFFAFDATWSLIQSLRKFCSQSVNLSLCIPMVNSSFCYHRRFPKDRPFFNITNTVEFLGVSGPIKFSANTTDRIDGIYFTVHNVQPSVNGIDFIPVLKWSYADHWKSYSVANVIIWPGNTLQVPTGVAGMAGIALQLCLIESPPFTIRTFVDGTNQSKLTGYIPDLIDMLQSQMGFTPDIILALPNQTYNGLIQDVANGICDLAVGDITITASRKEIVDFSISIFDNSLRIVIRQTIGSSLDLLSYLKPFAYDLWLLVLVSCIYAGLLLVILERRENEALKHRSIISAITMSMWYSLSTLIGYGADFHAETAGGRLLTAGLHVLSLVLVATYTANLASDLTTMKSSNFVSNLDDLKNGMVPFSRIGIVTGTSIEDFYIREISHGSRNFYPLKSPNDLFAKLLDQTIDVSIADTALLEYVTNKVYCNLTVVGADFDRSAYGIAAQKKWLYKNELDIAILSLKETGVLDDLKRKWFDGSMCQSPSSSNLSISINIITMSGLLLTFAAITALAILLCTWTKRNTIKNFLFVLFGRRNVSTVKTRY